MKIDITSDLVEILYTVPSIPTINQEMYARLNIRSIKDFSDHPYLQKEFHIYDRYLIWMNDGSGITFDIMPSGNYTIEEYFAQIIRES